MSFFDLIKGRLLGIPDAINRQLHPFGEFTRPAIILDPNSLADKDRFFWAAIDKGWRHGKIGEFYQYADPFDGGDSAYFHGWYTAACALRNDWPALQLAVKGLELLINLGQDSRLSRGIDEIGGRMKVGDPSRTYYKADGYVYHQDCSESSLIGVLTAAWTIWQVGAPKPIDDRISVLIRALADQIISDEYRLMNQNGSAARFGDLRPRWQTAPIRLGSLACLLLLAHRATGIGKYRDRYEAFADEHAGSLTHQETHVLWMHPYYQDVLAYQTYAMLATEDKDRGGRYRSALSHLWARTNHEGNPLYCALYKFAGCVPAPEYIEQARKTLEEFVANPSYGRTAKDPGSVDNTDSAFDEVHGFTWGPRWLRGGKRISRQPVPIHMRPAADFFWQRSPYSLEGYSDHRYNALDFSLAYHLGRKAGTL